MKNSLTNNTITAASADSFTITFSQALDAESFKKEYISLTDINGNKVNITSYEIEDNVLTVHFDKITETGRFKFALSNEIKNANGDLLDQNMDKSTGSAADKYEIMLNTNFSLPSVVKVDPAGDVAGTFTTFNIYFSSAIDFETLENNVTLTAPDNTVYQPKVIRKISDTIYQVEVEPQSLTGQYKIQVGSEVANMGGSKLDQNKNGIGGEDADKFVATFNNTKIDLEVSNVTLSADSGVSGDNITVKWDVANKENCDLFGSWSDGVYLSTDARWDIYDKLLGTFTYEGGLEAGESHNGELTVTLNGMTPGQYYILVRSDIYLDEKSDREAADLAQNLVAVPITVTVPELTVDKTVSGSVEKSGDFDYYVVRQDANDSLKVVLDSLVNKTNMEVYVGYGYAPDRENFDLSLKNITDGVLDIDAAQTGRDIYIMVNAKNVSSKVDYKLTVESVDLAITSVTPAIHGRGSAATFDIMGIDFNPECTVTFVNRASSRPSHL